MSSDYARSLGARLRAIRTQQGLSLHGVEEKSRGRWKAVVVGSYVVGGLAEQYLFHNATEDRPGLFLSTVSETFDQVADRSRADRAPAAPPAPLPPRRDGSGSRPAGSRR